MVNKPDKLIECVQRLGKSKGMPSGVAMNYLNDAKTRAMLKVLIDNKLTTKEKYWGVVDEELEELTQMLEKMPPIPRG